MMHDLMRTASQVEAVRKIVTHAAKVEKSLERASRAYIKDPRGRAGPATGCDVSARRSAPREVAKPVIPFQGSPFVVDCAANKAVVFRAYGFAEALHAEGAGSRATALLEPRRQSRHKAWPANALLPLVLLLGFVICGVAPARSAETDRLIQFYQLRVSEDPDDYSNYDRLGSAYMQKARETADPSSYELSERSYEQALTLLSPRQPESAGTLAHLAALYLSEHRFAESLDLAQQAIALDPGLRPVHATVGDVQFETGHYEEAGKSYARLKLPKGLLPPRPGLAYLSETREANQCYIQGRPQRAISHMRAAVAEAIAAGLPKENISWSYFSIGELYYGMGDLAKAESSYELSLAAYPNYHRALAWMGQLRAAQGRYAEAIELYRQAISVVPLPAYAAALGDIYHKTGQEDEARKEYELVELIARLSALNQNLFRRELASFYVEHNVNLKQALDLALAELGVRKDVHTWDVASWAYFANGEIAAARHAITQALAQGTQDPLIFFHAGMIYERAGNPAKARALLRRALKINPHFHIFYADLAFQMLSRLSQKNAVPILETASYVR